jgi:hypothetical protein
MALCDSRTIQRINDRAGSEQLQQTDWSDAMTAPPELRQQI